MPVVGDGYRVITGPSGPGVAHGPGMMSNTTRSNVAFFYCILTFGNADFNSSKIHLEITSFYVVFHLNFFRCKYLQ